MAQSTVVTLYRSFMLRAIEHRRVSSLRASANFTRNTSQPLCFFNPASLGGGSYSLKSRLETSTTHSSIKEIYKYMNNHNRYEPRITYQKLSRWYVGFNMKKLKALTAIHLKYKISCNLYFACHLFCRTFLYQPL